MNQSLHAKCERPKKVTVSSEEQTESVRMLSCTFCPTQISVSATLSDPDIQSTDFADCTCSKSRQNQRRDAVSDIMSLHPQFTGSILLLQVEIKEEESESDDEPKVKLDDSEYCKFHGKQVSV